MRSYISTNIGKFLSTFDEGQGQQQGGGQPQVQQQQQFVPPQPPAPAPAPAPAPQQQSQQPAPQANGAQTNGQNGQNGAVIPANAIGPILQAMQANGQQATQNYVHAAQNLASVQQQQQQTVANQPPPPTKQKDKVELLTEQVSSLMTSLEASNLESYRQTAMNKARQSGLRFSDTMVFGTSPSEIDAALGVAVAERAVIAGEIAAEMIEVQQQPNNGQQQQVQTQAVVSQVGGQPVAPQQPSVPQQNQVSAPSVVQVPGIPDQGVQQYSPDQIKYLTTHGLQTGEYAQHREQIQRQLRGQGGPGINWTTQMSPSLAPPVPQSAPAPTAAQQLQQHQPQAMPRSMYAGVQLPNIQAAPVYAAPGTILPPQAPAQPQAMVTQLPMHANQQAAGGFAPQPVQLNGGAPFDANAARFAANNSVAQARMRSQVVPNAHNSQ